MKKQFMATTALAAAGMLAGAAGAQAQGAKPTLSLGGWFEGIVGIVDDDDDDPRGDHVGIDVQQDSEIHFKGSARLDNGIETILALASYRRDLGPGVQYRLNFMYADYEGEATGSADDNDGYAVTTSIRLAF